MLLFWLCILYMYTNLRSVSYRYGFIIFMTENAVRFYLLLELPLFNRRFGGREPGI